MAGVFNGRLNCPEIDLIWNVNHFCTITTASHLYKVYALAESLQQFGECTLHVLVVDAGQQPAFNGCRFYGLQEIAGTPVAQTIIAKYKGNSNKLRWSLKPVMLQWLLKQKAIDRVIYLDNDLFFYSAWQFMFELLQTHSLLLTPHYYKHDPTREQNWFEANFRVGLYNAGFVGASRQATGTLQWWAESCAYRCEKNAWRGLFDDQKYLDLVPVMEEKAHVLRHKGCNVAGWNQELCPRIKSGNDVLIDGKFPVVFIHFNNYTISELLNGIDSLLVPHYERYEAVLKKHKPALQRSELFSPQPFSDKLKFTLWKIATDLGL